MGETTDPVVIGQLGKQEVKANKTIGTLILVSIEDKFSPQIPSPNGLEQLGHQNPVKLD
jgi:hypothetical protein